jgi:hypothetical protein
MSSSARNLVKDSKNAMTTLQHVADMDFTSDPIAHGAETAWSRWMRRIMGSPRNRALWARARRVPIYRIARVAEDSWVVERPGAVMEHAFPNLEQAVAFIRRESQDKPATVELRIDDLYVVAQIDPSQPGSLFGESVS